MPATAGIPPSDTPTNVANVNRRVTAPAPSTDPMNNRPRAPVRLRGPAEIAAAVPVLLGQSASRIGIETCWSVRTSFGVSHWLTVIATSGLTFALVANHPQRAGDVSRDIVDRARDAFGMDHWVSLLAAAARTFALIGIGDDQAAGELGADTLDRCAATLGEAHPIAQTLAQPLGALNSSAAD